MQKIKRLFPLITNRAIISSQFSKQLLPAIHKNNISNYFGCILPLRNFSMADKEELAQQVHKEDFENQPSIFDMIQSGKIPGDILYQDELCFAFRDVNPVAPVHFLVVPSTAYKQGLTGISQAEEKHEAVLGRMMVVAAKVAR